MVNKYSQMDLSPGKIYYTARKYNRKDQCLADEVGTGKSMRDSTKTYSLGQPTSDAAMNYEEYLAGSTFEVTGLINVIYGVFQWLCQIKSLFSKLY